MRGVVGLVLCAGLALFGTSSAWGASSGEQVTVAWVNAAGVDGPMRTQVFENVAAAALAASGGRIELAEDATIKELVAALQDGKQATNGESVQSSLLSSTIIGIDWDGANYSGSNLVWSAPNAVGCADGSVFTANAMPAGWGDRVSSAQAFGGCNTYGHYDFTFQSGSSITCTCSSMGFMDNRTSSERWAP